MSDPDVSIAAARRSSRAGNRVAEIPLDGREQAPDEDRGSAIRAKALEILRREYGPGKVAPASPPARADNLPAAAPTAPPADPSKPSTELSVRPDPPEIAIRQLEIGNEVIPARMLNEFVYCPRLFYYEFVEGVFVDNADTVRGKHLHRRVDTDSGGALPAAKGKSEVRGPKFEGKRTQSEAVGQQSLFGEERATPSAEATASLASGSRREEAQTPDSDTSPQPSPPGGDAEGGPSALNPQATTDEIIHSRSVQMGSPRLGVTAKMDLVEVRTGGDDLWGGLEVCPVDYKAGAPREGDAGNELWDADRMQLGLQALILRDNGYACKEGVIYYRATKQRVRLPITPELEAWIVEQVGAARRAAGGAIPSPLVASSKCPRCSLVTVCLPDETRLLAHAEDEKAATTSPRRLIAARDDCRALYLNTPGLRIGRKEELLQIKEERTLLAEVRIMDVAHVALFGNIQISTQAIQTLCEAEVPVTYFSMGGWFYGITRGHELKNVFLRIEQFRQAQDPLVCLRLARQFVNGKIRNHRTMLMRNHLEPPPATLLTLKQMADAALRAEAMDELLGIEGNGASAYFGQFAGMIKTEDDLPAGAEGAPTAAAQQRLFNFNFTHRNRRPPTDPVNAMLSLAYSLLAKDCMLALLAVGFDPYVGFYHQPRFGRPALALDLMEEFRALVGDSTVLSCINNRAITEDDFVRAGQAVNLSAPGRRRFFELYEQRMNSVLTHPVFDYKVSYRRALELQARMLAKVLTAEIPEYVPLTTR
jgi:CRISPR-associated protein Cas1